MNNTTAKYTHKKSIFDEITLGMDDEAKKIMLGAFKVLMDPSSERSTRKGGGIDGSNITNSTSVSCSYRTTSNQVPG